MRIGIDLDDTIFNTTEKYKELQPYYLKEKNINEKELWSNNSNRFDFIKSNFENIFLNLSVKRNVKSTLKFLKSLGYEIYIITARSKRYNKDIYNITKESLGKNNILFDKLILTEKEKLDACLENNIDIMIDNSIDVYNELSEKLNIILFDENKDYPNIKSSASSWKEVKDYFKEE